MILVTNKVLKVVLNMSSIAFTGSRHSHSIPCQVASQFCISLFKENKWTGEVSVGCPSGVDEVIRLATPSSKLSIFNVSDYPASSYRISLALRSSACVNSASMLVAFPLTPTPPKGIVWSGEKFFGAGSGSWGSVGFAFGLGMPILLFIPSIPKSAISGFTHKSGLPKNFIYLEQVSNGSWWFSPPSVTSDSEGGTQLRLF